VPHLFKQVFIACLEVLQLVLGGQRDFADTCSPSVEIINLFGFTLLSELFEPEILGLGLGVPVLFQMLLTVGLHILLELLALVLKAVVDFACDTNA
jgi:hypothetical protein